VVNMTGQDVIRAENWYTGNVSNGIRVFLARSQEINDYRRSQGHIDRDHTRDHTRDQAAILNIVANVTPPIDTGSWFQDVDHLIILGNEVDNHLLHTDMEEALGWNDTRVEGMCIPTATFAARGAALRGRQWRRRHDYRGEPRRWDEDEMDWVPTEEWIGPE
jgi:hypothetical protein